MSDDLALYIHWPFCLSKCPYCDFNSHVSDKINQNTWLQAYKNNLDMYQEFIKSRKIRSIFFGGGTPSLMNPDLVAKILGYIQEISNYNSNEIEITLEANPTSFEKNKFKDFALAGVNRISLGVQSLNDKNLKFLGRNHSAKEAITAIEFVSENFKKSSFDLIYALPNQSKYEWSLELKKALQFNFNHMSLYQLTIEKGTQFFKQHQLKEFNMPSNEDAEELYLLTEDIMNNSDLPAYEVSNYAMLGHECLHNKQYWNYSEFLGIGPGAHSRINNQSLIAIYNPDNWLKKILNMEKPYQQIENLTEQNIIYEFILMGLRLINGITEDRLYQLTSKKFAQVFNLKKIDYLQTQGLINIQSNVIKLSLKGRLLLNEIVTQIII